MALRAIILTVAAFLVGSCVGSDDGPLSAAFIGEEDAAYTTGLLLSPAAQHVRAATSEGLVVREPNGLVAPGLADRWIVTDDGHSYVFRMREGEWPDGSALTAESVQRRLEARLKELEGTSLGLDLQPIDDIRTMAERVIEFRLSTPAPYLLELLAQPELALTPTGEKSIPMGLLRLGERVNFDLSAPERRGLPMVENWDDWVRRIEFKVERADKAVALFNAGDVDLVLGGTGFDFALAEVGPLSRGTVRLDPAIGIFGLQVRRAEGLLADPATREAISLAIDRDALVSALNIGGWTASTRIVPPGFLGENDPREERWQPLDAEERRTEAARRIAAVTTPDQRTLSLLLPDGANGDVLFEELKRQMLAVGITLRPASERSQADLVWRDRVARFRGARWFANQFSCALEQGFCSEEADLRIREYLASQDPAEREEKLLAAVQELENLHLFIPFGSPIRWSLVRSNVDGFETNPWAFHPLPAMAQIPR